MVRKERLRGKQRTTKERWGNGNYMMSLTSTMWTAWVSARAVRRGRTAESGRTTQSIGRSPIGSGNIWQVKD